MVGSAHLEETKKDTPRAMIPDNAKELTEGDFKRKHNKAQCLIKPVEAYTPNANIAEHVIRELKRMHRRVIMSKGVPEVLWDYCFEWCSIIRSHTSANFRGLDG